MEVTDTNKGSFRLPVRRGSLLEFFRDLEEKKIPKNEIPVKFIFIDGTESVPVVEPRTAILRWFEE